MLVADVPYRTRVRKPGDSKAMATSISQPKPTRERLARSVERPHEMQLRPKWPHRAAAYGTSKLSAVPGRVFAKPGDSNALATFDRRRRHGETRDLATHMEVHAAEPHNTRAATRQSQPHNARAFTRTRLARNV